MNAAAALADFVRAPSRLAIVSGAGISTASGIPDYRGRDGQWRHARPVQYPDFVARAAVRQRYWAHSLLGWPRMAGARPNAAHRALADMQSQIETTALITQNVDGLHQQAGSTGVIDLHGRLDTVSCLSCKTTFPRADWQHALTTLNPGWFEQIEAVRDAPDGDAAIDGADYDSFVVRDCPVCGGIVKPDVVFFGEAVPPTRVEAAYRAVDTADALLVVGSSLVVFSGFRFARRAAAADKPIALVNLGYNRAADLATLTIDEDCNVVLPAALGLLRGGDDHAAAQV
ncbi:MAG: NAD-dependent protein deacetylase [Pseudomonadota bacterium]